MFLAQAASHRDTVTVSKSATSGSPRPQETDYHSSSQTQREIKLHRKPLHTPLSKPLYLPPHPTLLINPIRNRYIVEKKRHARSLHIAEHADFSEEFVRGASATQRYEKVFGKALCFACMGWTVAHECLLVYFLTFALTAGHGFDFV
jgi:hypothetical protein